jgi:hypothetical protein
MAPFSRRVAHRSTSRRIRPRSWVHLRPLERTFAPA